MMIKQDRRSLLALGGGLALATSVLGGPAQSADDLSAADKAKLKLVSDFCDAWKAPLFDVAAMVATYFAQDAEVRFANGRQRASGRADIIAMLGSYLNDGQRFELKILKSAMFGPIVINERIDTAILRNAAPIVSPIVGVFFISGGKIKEWFDYDNL